MSKFGWSYPAGAENDPFAPYNQDSEPPNNDVLKEAFQDYDGLYDLYRQTYKYTDCGPSVGTLIETETTEEDGFGSYAVRGSKWLYCDDLRELGSWDDLDSLGIPILAISVSSIVEGVDQTTEEIVIDVSDDAKDLRETFDLAVAEISKQADKIWKDTHGCESCGPENGLGYRTINPDCTVCGGEGEAF